MCKQLRLLALIGGLLLLSVEAAAWRLLPWGVKRAAQSVFRVRNGQTCDRHQSLGLSEGASFAFLNRQGELRLFTVPYVSLNRGHRVQLLGPSAGEAVILGAHQHAEVAVGRLQGATSAPLQIRDKDLRHNERVYCIAPSADPEQAPTITRGRVSEAGREAYDLVSLDETVVPVHGSVFVDWWGRVVGTLAPDFYAVDATARDQLAAYRVDPVVPGGNVRIKPFNSHRRDLLEMANRGDPRVLSLGFSFEMLSAPEREELSLPLGALRITAWDLGVEAPPGAGEGAIVERIESKHFAKLQAAATLYPTEAEDLLGGATLDRYLRMGGIAEGETFALRIKDPAGATHRVELEAQLSPVHGGAWWAPFWPKLPARVRRRFAPMLDPAMFIEAGDPFGGLFQLLDAAANGLLGGDVVVSLDGGGV